MKVVVQYNSPDFAFDMLDVYTDGLRPICRIWEEDFCELLTDKQIEKFQNGQYKFDVNKIQLLDKAKTIFPNY